MNRDETQRGWIAELGDGASMEDTLARAIHDVDCYAGNLCSGVTIQDRRRARAAAEAVRDLLTERP